jgi:hypothetical protein
LREAKNLNAPWQSHHITQEHWSPDALGMTYTNHREMTVSRWTTPHK